MAWEVPGTVRLKYLILPSHRPSSTVVVRGLPFPKKYSQANSGLSAMILPESFPYGAGHILCIQKSISPLLPGPWVAGVANDWCIILILATFKMG